MRLTINRMLAMVLIPTFGMFIMNKRNTDQNRAALKAAMESKRKEERE